MTTALFKLADNGNATSWASRLRARPDFQRNPALAILKRVWWRLRWVFNKKPWLLPLGRDLKILAPKGGAGALIYYLGYSEPEIAEFVDRRLQPGMTFWDVGAHIGEYSLLAAQKVGADGYVAAFEPQPAMAEFLRGNVRRNGLSNVDLHELAIAENDGKASLALTVEPSTAFIQSAQANGPKSLLVRTTSLDNFLSRSTRTPHFIKVDVEGSELYALRGARHLLSLPAPESPTWIMEFEPDNCGRAGYDAGELISYFQGYGFTTYWLSGENNLERISATNSRHGRTVIATKGDL